MTHKSRFGFHPCSYAIYCKLKILAKAYFQTIHDVAVWIRWNRKEPQNRVSRKRIRNDRGQVVGYEESVPIPEPKFCDLFAQKQQNKWNPLITEVVWNKIGETIVDDYRNARYPCAEEAVMPLKLSEEEIDRFYHRL